MLFVLCWASPCQSGSLGLSYLCTSLADRFCPPPEVIGDQHVLVFTSPLISRVCVIATIRAAFLSQVAAWNCVYTVLLAHAEAAKQFRALVPGGKLSINLNCDFAEPLTRNPRDVVQPPSAFLALRTST